MDDRQRAIESPGVETLLKDSVAMKAIRTLLEHGYLPEEVEAALRRQQIEQGGKNHG